MKTKEDVVERIVKELETRKSSGERLDKWRCPYCPRTVKPFDTHQARNNHIRFNHPGQPLPKMSREESLARKRVYNAEYRAERKKVPHYQTPEYRKQLYQDQKAKYAARGLNAQGKRYKRLPRRLREQEAIHHNQKVAKAFEPIVYHAPFEVPVRECPHCKQAFPSGVVWREEK